MPCQSDYTAPTPQERETATHAAHYLELQKVKGELDRLTRENDELREALITVKEGGELVPTLWMKIGREQVRHRKEDLARLEKQFRASIADQKAMGREGQTDLHAKLGLVVTADPTKPLAPQLGFDPDSV